MHSFIRLTRTYVRYIIILRNEIGGVDNIEKLIMEGIIGLIPLYIDMKGNSTRVITKENSEVYIYKSIRTVLNIIARYFSIPFKVAGTTVE